MAEPFPGVPWIHLADPDDAALDLLAQQHGLHELDVEDCRHRRQVAKVTSQANYNFVVIKTVQYDQATGEVLFEDFDLFILPQLLLTVAEGSTSVVARTQEKLPQEPEFHHAQGIAYLLMDRAVDEYQPVLDEVGNMIEAIEDEVLARPTPEVLQKILHLKSVLVAFRRNATAMREVLNHVMRAERPEQPNSLYPYYRDVYDHLVRALDFIESYRDLLTGALDIYLSAVANRTGDVVKLLTIIGTISIPLVVVTGFYGMNIHLPMQESPFAVYFIIGALGSASLAMLLFFWRKGWL